MLARLCEALAARLTVGYEHQPERLEGVVAAGDVVADGVDDEPQELVVLRRGGGARSFSPRARLSAGAAARRLTSLSSTEVTMYPTCFSAYFGDEIRPTASMCPNSTS